MKTRIYFFFKNYLGFSNRESRGFVLVLPVLFLLYIIPEIYGYFLHRKNKQNYQVYLHRVDSLVNAGWVPLESDNNYQQKVAQDTGKTTSVYKKPRSPELTKIPFSEADSAVLQIVPGIGQVMAGRIVKFRDNIGGLYQKDQLLEVYGMKPEVMDKVFEYFEFVPGIMRKLSINHQDVNTLAKHPYLNYGSAKVIVAYRDQHGLYKSPEDLLKIKIFNEDWLDRLKPYLEF